MSDLLPKVLRKRGLADHANAALATHRAQGWLHKELPALRGMARVLCLQGGELQIGCSHAIAAQECQACVEGLLAYLQENCPGVVIRSVRVVRSTEAGK